MPKVTKQSVNSIRTALNGATSSALDRITPVGDDDSGIFLLVYGRTKTGKTRLFSTFPKPSLLIGCAGYGTEKGTRSIKHVKGIDFVDIQKTDDMEELCEFIKTGKSRWTQRKGVWVLSDKNDGEPYATAGLDTAGGFQDRVVNEYLGRTPSLRKDWSSVPKTEWGIINDRTIVGLRKLIDLSIDYSKHVVIIAHERNFTENQDTELLTPNIGAALTPGVTGWLNGSADYICQTLIRKEIEMVSVELMKGKYQTVPQETGNKQYCLRVGPHEVYQTGFRWEGEGKDLPNFIVNPNYDKIVDLIGGKLPS